MCGKVLIVDDEPDIQGMINLKMRRQIRAGKYNFLFASNGSEAIEF
jgi:adenylate cyclase